MSAFEAACLASFVGAGHEVVLYSYDRLNVPAGVRLMSASEVLDRGYLQRFITGGKPNIAHFADYFRLTLLLKTSDIWIDCDMIHLSDFDFEGQDNILVRENSSGIINSILRIRDKALLKDCLSRTEALLDRDVPWAAPQNVISKALMKRGSDIKVQSARRFVPIHYDSFQMLLLPEYYDECVELCRAAATVHVYNNILDKIGFFKNILPPEGSFLHSIFADDAAKFGFTDTYPSSVVRALVQGLRAQVSGEVVGVGNLIRQAIPSIRRTVQRRLKC